MSDYEVGYGKPPKAGRIRKGEVRNPDGRRGKSGAVTRAPDNSTSAILERLDAEIIEVNGQKMTRRECELRVLLAKSMKGDAKISTILEGLRAKSRANTTNPGGGVLLLPSEVPLEEWEASAAIQQAKFRERPNDYKSDDSDQY